jgi:hypothetical protein
VHIDVDGLIEAPDTGTEAPLPPVVSCDLFRPKTSHIYEIMTRRKVKEHGSPKPSTPEITVPG